MIMNTNISDYKYNIKTLNRNAAFKDLIKVQLSLSNVLYIKYETFQGQPYQTSGMLSNEEVSILSSLYSHQNNLF